MGHSLLIVSGSFRRLGNCEMFAKQIALCSQAERITSLRLTDFTLKPCMGCYRCLNPEHRCKVPDDLYFLIDTLKEYTGIIFSVPTYVLGPVGQFKLLADRLACMASYHAGFQQIPAVSAVFGGIEGWRGVTQGLVNAVIRMMGFPLAGSAFVEAALPGESLTEANMPVAQGLADALNGKGPFFPSKTQLCPDCGSDLFFAQAGRLVCAMCASSGEYRDGAWHDFKPSHRFTEQGFTEHFEGWLKPKVVEYNAQKERHALLRARFKDVGAWVRKPAG